MLDLARFPEDYRVSWRWTDSGPEGWIAATDWRLDLDAISGVYARFLGPDDRPQLPSLDPYGQKIETVEKTVSRPFPA
jgi:hypothetical protein